MRIEKKAGGIDGKWAKVGADIRDGDRIKILDAGIVDDSGNFGPKKVFKIMTHSKEEFNLGFNQTSLNNLVDGFGGETEEWVNKVVSAFVVRQMVGDGLKNVLYIAPEGWTMDDDGKFAPEKSLSKEIPDGISPDDIPF